METERKGNSSQQSFFENTQKLTFALGLSSGLAVMAIAGLILFAVRDNSGTTRTTTTTAAAADTTDTGTADTGQYDPALIADSIGIDKNKFDSCMASKKFDTRINNDLSSGETAGVNGTPTSFVNGTAISGALPYSQLKAAIDAALAGTKGTASVPAVTDEDHVDGAKNPKVTVIEYSDFQCPYCKQFTPSIKQALNEYKDSVQVVYRHFPLESIHPQARALAHGSECAADIGGNDKFWEFHDATFGV